MGYNIPKAIFHLLKGDYGVESHFGGGFLPLGGEVGLGHNHES